MNQASEVYTENKGVIKGWCIKGWWRVLFHQTVGGRNEKERRFQRERENDSVWENGILTRNSHSGWVHHGEFEFDGSK